MLSSANAIMFIAGKSFSDAKQKQGLHLHRLASALMIIHNSTWCRHRTATCVYVQSGDQIRLDKTGSESVSGQSLSAILFGDFLGWINFAKVPRVVTGKNWHHWSVLYPVVS